MQIYKQLEESNTKVKYQWSLYTRLIRSNFKWFVKNDIAKKDYYSIDSFFFVVFENMKNYEYILVKKNRFGKGNAFLKIHYWGMKRKVCKIDH